MFVKKIGAGIDGDVFKITLNNKKPFVFKIGDKHTIQNEEVMHNNIYDKLKCKKSFVKPLKLSNDLKKIIYKRFKIDKNEHGYAMEYVEGVTLREFYAQIKNSKMFSTISKQLQTTFKCLWKQGFIHGDAHMGNIMVTFYKGEPKIKLFDFGFSMKFNTPISINDDKELLKWFRTKWKRILTYKNVPKGNPDSIYLNINFLPFFAENNKTLMKLKYNEMSSVKY